MEDESRERLQRGAVDFTQVVMRQLLEIQKQESSDSLALGALRSLDRSLKPYKDKKFRDGYAKLQATVERAKKNGMTAQAKNQMIANGWKDLLMDLLYRKKFLPKIRAIWRDEEYLEGI